MKQYSSKRSIQILGHVLQQYGINKVVVSPGSRNAPLAIHFSELDDFQCYSIVDERAAAFVGMGMAKSLKQPVAITCTSGSAATNYYPAIVEAFYQNIPLLVLTADRPVDFVDLFDDQKGASFVLGGIPDVENEYCIPGIGVTASMVFITP